MLKEELTLVNHPLKSPKFIIITITIIAVIVVPLTLIEIQHQQTIQQHASTTPWKSYQSASSAIVGSKGAYITATFTNAELPGTSTGMNVIATDTQTGKSFNMGIITGGQTKTATISTGRSGLAPGQITFSMSWANGQAGTTTTTTNYNGCGQMPTPTPKTTVTPAQPSTPAPTVPPGVPTPTICPTLQPVQNVKIICPNCQLNQQ